LLAAVNALILLLLLLLLVVVVAVVVVVVVRVLGDRSGAPGSIPGTTRKKK
jgi:hypothetical protein